MFIDLPVEQIPFPYQLLSFLHVGKTGRNSSSTGSPGFTSPASRRGDAAGDDLPVMIIFDALDGRIHEDEPSQKKLSYCEFARIRLDGKVQGINIRNVRKTVQGPRPSGDQCALTNIRISG